MFSFTPNFQKKRKGLATWWFLLFSRFPRVLRSPMLDSKAYGAPLQLKWQWKLFVAEAYHAKMFLLRISTWYTMEKKEAQHLYAQTWSPKSPGKYFQPLVLRLLNLLLASCYSLLIYNCKYYLLAHPHASLNAWMAFFDLYCTNCFWISRITPFWLWHMPSPPSSLPEVTMAVHIYCRSLRSLRRHYKIFSK